jgi:hypothetical protein
VPYTGATGNVTLGTNSLTAGVGSFASSGGDPTFSINHSSGSGIALNITKGGNGEGLYINKTSGTGNAATIIGTLNATTLVKNGGTSSQFLKADGSVDSSTYLTTSSASSTYLPLAGGTLTGALSGTSATFSGNVTTTGSGYFITATSLAMQLNGSVANDFQLNGGGPFRVVNQAYNAVLMQVNNNGNVGIGTTSPSALLSFGANTNEKQLLIFESGNAFGGFGIASGEFRQFGWSSATNGITFGFVSAVDGTTYTERMRITSGGNVGIGTSSPLSISGYGIVSLNGTTGSIFNGVSNGTSASYFGTDTQSTFVYELRNAFLGFGTNGIERMRITSGGDVGIGTSSPSNYSGWTTLTLNSATNGGVVDFLVNGTRTGSIYTTGGGTVFSMEAPQSNGSLTFNTNSNERMRITSGGNVLIGTTTDSAGVKLKVAGGIIGCLDVYNNTTAVAANLNIDANGFFARSTSSLKYKKNINNLTKGLAEVLQLRPVTYNSINETETQTYAGLIAEEVHELGLTEFVQYAEDGSPDALSYSNMVSLLVKAIQELKAEIDELKNK